MISRASPYFPNENSLNITVNTPQNIPLFQNIIIAVIIVISIYFLIIPLIWGIIYQIKYNKGEEYLRGELSKEDKEKLRKEFKGWLNLLKKK